MILPVCCGGIEVEFFVPFTPHHFRFILFKHSSLFRGPIVSSSCVFSVGPIGGTDRFVVLFTYCMAGIRCPPWSVRSVVYEPIPCLACIGHGSTCGSVWFGCLVRHGWFRSFGVTKLTPGVTGPLVAWNGTFRIHPLPSEGGHPPPSCCSIRIAGSDTQRGC